MQKYSRLLLAQTSALCKVVGLILIATLISCSASKNNNSASVTVNKNTLDVNKPYALSILPPDKQTAVGVDSGVTIRFSEPIEKTSISTSTFSIASVSGSVAYDSALNTATFFPTAVMQPSTTYTVNLTNKIVDLNGNSLDPIALQFTTSSVSTAAPVTSAAPSSGIYQANQVVTLTCTPDAGRTCSTTYYTTDGTDPTIQSTKYTAAISITASTTLKFFSVDDGGTREIMRTSEYAINTPSPSGFQWYVQTIDSSPLTGQYTSLAVDVSNNIHISYYDSTNGDLKYATNSSGQWLKYTVDSTGDVGKWNSIGVDNGVVHISYYDATNGYLKYATTSTPNLWNISVLDSTLNSGFGGTSLVIVGGAIKIAYFKPNYLFVITVGQSSTNTRRANCMHSSMKADINGFLHISCGRVVFDIFYYLTNKSGAWISTYLSGATGNTSLALDSNSLPHIARSHDLSTPRLEYWSQETGRWISSLILTGTSGSSSEPSIVITSDGTKHLFSYSPFSGDLYYRSFTTQASNGVLSGGNGGAWIDKQGDVGRYTSAGVDSLSRIHVSYYGNGTLKYAVYK